MARSLRSILKRLLPRGLHPVRFHLARKARASRLRQDMLGQYATAILTQGWNGKLLVAATDMEVGRRLAFDGSYNRREIEFHLGNLTAESEVLFVGAHVGSLLVPVAPRVRRVVGIEANPRTFGLLEMNVRLNGLENAELHQIAAGDRNGEIDFVIHTHNTGNSLIKHGEVDERDPVWGYDKPEVVRVPLRRLDDALGPRTFDLIVMDIEGAEYLALRGMVGILSRARRLQLEVVPYFVERVAGATCGQLVDLLREHFDHAWILGNLLNGEGEVPFEALAVQLANGGRLIDLYLAKDALDQGTPNTRMTITGKQTSAFPMVEGLSGRAGKKLRA